MKHHERPLHGKIFSGPTPAGEIPFPFPDLPAAIYRHLQGKELEHRIRPESAFVEWAEASIKFSPKGKWHRVGMEQFNQIDKPGRSVQMRIPFFGPFHLLGRDHYGSGQGSLQLNLNNLFCLDRCSGRDTAQSELAVTLAEALIIPAYLLMPYIEWQERSAHYLHATIRDAGTRAAGYFTIGEDGDLMGFSTNDRFLRHNGELLSTPWRVEIIKDLKTNQSTIRAIWITRRGDWEYFRGRVAAVHYKYPCTDNPD